MMTPHLQHPVARFNKTLKLVRFLNHVRQDLLIPQPPALVCNPKFKLLPGEFNASKVRKRHRVPATDFVTCGP